MMKKLIALISSVAISCTLLVGCGSNTTTKDFHETITFGGASTIAPIINTEANDFKNVNKTWNKVDKNFPNKEISIVVNAGGSGEGIKGVIDDSVNFGLVSREVSKDEKEKIKDYKEYKLGVDALTISVNPENPILKIKDNLTTEQVKKIFSGEFAYWDDVDKSLEHKEIVVVTRDLGGGAHKVFQKKVMGDTKVKKDVIQAPSMGSLVYKVIENKYTIGYASFGVVNQNKGKIQPLKVDGIEATKENIANGNYKISRPLLVINNGEPTLQEKYFIDTLISDKGMKVVEKLGFVPAK